MLKNRMFIDDTKLPFAQISPPRDQNLGIGLAFKACRYFTLRLYASRNRILSIVPYPTVRRNSSVQQPVMIRPVGKMPKVRPGNTKAAALAAADDADAPVEVDVLV